MDRPLLNLAGYPMGPAVRKWLDIEDSEYSGQTAEEISEDDSVHFEAVVAQRAVQHGLAQVDLLPDLVDELTAMGFAGVAIKLIDHNEDHWHRRDFRSAHTEGIAAMLSGAFDRAITCFSDAQRAAPFEPAAYTNLVKLLAKKEEISAAWQWAEAGLDHVPDHYPLWEQIVHLVKLKPAEGSEIGKSVTRLARQYNSWVGHSLASELDPGFGPSKADALRTFFDQGERSWEFLVEYTGALGEDGQFEEVSQILWQLKSGSDSNQIPWQLQIHGAQARLALGNEGAFQEEAAAALKDPLLPDHVRQELNRLMTETSSAH